MLCGCKFEIVVLITGAFHSFGGIETFNRALLKALDEIAAARNLRVQVLSLLDEAKAAPASLYVTSGRVLFRGFSGSRVQLALSACRVARSADIVIIGHANLLPLVSAMNGSFKCLVAHGIEVWKEMTLLQRLGASRVDRILCVSGYTQRKMMRLDGMASDRFRIFPNTLDPLYAQEQHTKLCRADLGLPPGPMLLSVSRLAASERYKNIGAVIRCLPEVLRQIPEAFYVIVGDGTERKTFQEQAHSLGLDSKVILPGWVPHDLLGSYYAACDVFVLPSTKEGFGIVFLEAMCHGKPCIGARAGGVPEVVNDGATGVLVESPDQPHALPNAILRLLTDAALRLSMGKRGSEELERNFAFPLFRDRLERILYPVSATEL